MPLPRDHPSYEVIRAAAQVDRKWLDFLQPEDRDLTKREPPKAQSRLPIKTKVESGVTTRVHRRGCRAKCKWSWVVLLDGVVQESGQEETKELAQDRAQSESKALVEHLKATGRL